MKQRFQLFSLPNILTLGNLACGVLSIWMATHGRMELALWLIVIAGVLDFLDGFVARALKSFSPIGADLDSLADVVTFGVAPGVLMMTVISGMLTANVVFDNLEKKHTQMAESTQRIAESFASAFGVDSDQDHPAEAKKWQRPSTNLEKLVNLSNQRELVSRRNKKPPKDSIYYSEGRFQGEGLLTLIALIIPLFGALRLAKFNVDTTPYPGFNGLPIPANALFFVGLVPWVDSALQNPDMPLAGMLTSPYFLAGTCVVIATCMILPIPLMALKFKGFGLQKNIWKYGMIVSAVTLGAIFQLKALPFILLLYFLLSAGEHFSRKTQASDEVQS